MYISIGIDVSKEKLDLGWLRDPIANKKKTKVFDNRPAHLASIRDWILKNTKAEPADIQITIESTSVYHEAVVYFLAEQGFKIFMPNPAKFKHFVQSQGVVHKTDKSDAIMLARYGLNRGDQPLWVPERPEIRALKGMLRRLAALEKDRQRELNRLETAQLSGASSVVLQSLKDVIHTLETQIETLEKHIDDHIDDDPEMKITREQLTSIPGVGAVVSREMVYLLLSRLFLTARQVACYVGVIPSIEESGRSLAKSRMSKQGPSRLRAKLYMAAVVAKRFNPDVRAQYERLTKAGKTNMQAIVAAMRKLVHICFGVVKNQQKFEPQTL